MCKQVTWRSSCHVTSAAVSRRGRCLTELGCPPVATLGTATTINHLPTLMWMLFMWKLSLTFWEERQNRLFLTGHNPHFEDFNSTVPWGWVHGWRIGNTQSWVYILFFTFLQFLVLQPYSKIDYIFLWTGIGCIPFPLIMPVLWGPAVVDSADWTWRHTYIRPRSWQCMLGHWARLRGMVWPSETGLYLGTALGKCKEKWAQWPPSLRNGTSPQGPFSGRWPRTSWSP